MIFENFCILLINDDGICVYGLKLLEKIVCEFFDDIWIVVLYEEQFGVGCLLMLYDLL